MSTFLKYKLKYDVTVYNVKINMMSPPQGYRLWWTMLPYPMLNPFPKIMTRVFLKNVIYIILKPKLNLRSPKSCFC